MRKIFLVLLVPVTFLVVNRCYYDNEEKLYPHFSSDCDTTHVTFSVTVHGILQSSCLSCHSNANASGSGGGIKLENYTDVITQVTNGKLMGSVNHKAGYSAMPKGGGKLTTCEIAQMQAWINAGATNN